MTTRPAPGTYFHGTALPADPGMVLLPRATTGMASNWAGVPAEQANWVYLTDYLPGAVEYAQKAAAVTGGSPHVYQVRVDGPVEFVADFDGEIHHRAPHATVLTAVRT